MPPLCPLPQQGKDVMIHRREGPFAICFLIDFAVLLYAKGFKLLALDRERTPNTATSQRKDIS